MTLRRSGEPRRLSFAFPWPHKHRKSNEQAYVRVFAPYAFRSLQVDADWDPGRKLMLTVPPDQFEVLTGDVEIGKPPVLPTWARPPPASPPSFAHVAFAGSLGDVRPCCSRDRGLGQLPGEPITHPMGARPAR